MIACDAARCTDCPEEAGARVAVIGAIARGYDGNERAHGLQERKVVFVAAVVGCFEDVRVEF